MCEYCEKNHEFAKSPDLSLTIEGNILIVEDLAYFCGTYKEEINFCPMCGRKLSNDKTE